MKKYCLVCFIIITLIYISSCSIKNNNEISKIHPDEKETSISAIKDIIQNKKEFISTENDQYYFLQDYHSGNYLFMNDEGQYEYTENAEKMDYIFSGFSVIDMDEDGYPELLLEETDYGNIILFHFENDEVYGFVFPCRGFENVKKDASYMSSGGANFNTIGTIKFLKGKAIYNELCFFDGWDNVYRINGKNVSQEDAENYLNDQFQKENVEWYIYNESNLGKYFVP